MSTIDIGYFFMKIEINRKTDMLNKEEICNPIKNVAEGVVNEIGR